MIHAHSLGRAANYYGERTALALGGTRSTFRELHDRVAGIAAALSRHGFRAGDRLAMLLPNEPEYIELVYACAWLGVIAVPLNTRLSATEIDHVLADASPRGLIRHSSLPVPTVQAFVAASARPGTAWTFRAIRYPEAIYDPEAILASSTRAAQPAVPRASCVTHANILANVDHLNYWMPYQEGGVHLHAAPIFHIWTFRSCSRHRLSAPARSRFRSSARKASARRSNANASATSVLVPTMINLLTQFAELEKYDLTSLEKIGVWRISHGSGAHPPDERGSAEPQTGSGLRTERNGLSYRPAGP